MAASGTSASGKGCATVFLLVFFAAGVLFGAGVLAAVWTDFGVFAWERTPCRIVTAESRFADAEKADEPAFRFEVRYKYSFAGREYESSRLTQGSGLATSDWAKIQRRLDRYKAGSGAECFVDPDDPAQAVLERSFPWILMLLSVPGVFVLVSGGGLYGIWFHRAKRESDALSDRARKDKFWNPWGKLIVFLFLALLGGGIFGGFLLRESVDSIGSRWWQEVPCTILFSRVGSHSGDDGTTYSVDVLYSYTVAGAEYKSSQYTFVDLGSSGREDKDVVVKRLPRGASTVCYVDPSRPERAVLDRSFQSFLLIGLIPLGIFLIGAIGLMTMFVKAVRGKPEEGASPRGRPPDAMGPQVLRPAVSGSGRVLGCGCFALIWNGVTSVFVVMLVQEWLKGEAPWGPSLVVSPFVLVGLGTMAGTLYYFVALFGPKLEFRLTPGEVRLGGSAALDWRIRAGMGTVGKLTVTLIGREEATYRRGTNSVTDKEEFHKLVIYNSGEASSITQGAGTIRIPKGSMHSFVSNNNKVAWLLEVKGVVNPGPDIDEEFPLEIKPLAPERRF